MTATLLNEILDDTINFYAADPDGRRAVNTWESGEYVCEYLTEGGRKCAIGRLTANPGDLPSGLVSDSAVWAEIEWASRAHAVVPQEFWTHLQQLHDLPRNWDLDGLTQGGLEEVERFRKRIADGRYPLLPPFTSERIADRCYLGQS